MNIFRQCTAWDEKMKPYYKYLSALGGFISLLAAISAGVGFFSRYWIVFSSKPSSLLPYKLSCGLYNAIECVNNVCETKSIGNTSIDQFDPNYEMAASMTFYSLIIAFAIAILFLLFLIFNHVSFKTSYSKKINFIKIILLFQVL